LDIHFAAVDDELLDGIGVSAHDVHGCAFDNDMVAIGICDFFDWGWGRAEDFAICGGRLAMISSAFVMMLAITGPSIKMRKSLLKGG